MCSTSIDQIIDTVIQKTSFEDCTITMYKSSNLDKWLVETVYFNANPDEEPEREYFHTEFQAEQDYDNQVEFHYYGDEF